jgi:large repetitive protein
VQALNANGFGPFATIQSGPLSGVGGLTGTSGNTNVLLTWRPPASTGGLSVSGYKILYSTTTSGLTSSPITASANTASNATNFQINGLTNGVPYYFSVTPLLGVSNIEGPIATTSATPNAGPGAPINLGVSPGTGSVTISWAPSSSTVFTINGYYLDYSADNGVTYVPGTPTLIPFGTNSALVGVGGVGDTALTNGVNYLFRVRVVYTSNSLLTIGSAGTITGAALASATRPSAVTAAATAPGTVVVAWVAATGETGLNTQAYQIQGRIGYETSTAWLNLVPNTGSQNTTATLTGLTPGALYQIRVSAITPSFTSLPSDTATVTVLGAPNIPANFVATPSDSIVQLSWQPPTPSPGVTVNGYQLDYSVNSVDWTPLAVTDPVTFRATAFSLTNGVQYFFRITALSTAGVGSYAYVNAIPAALASAPILLSANGSAGSVLLVWAAPSNTGGGVIAGYQIDQAAVGTSSWTPAIANTNSGSTTYSVTGLANGVALQFRVAAITGAGPGQFSQALTATPFGSPSAPVGLAAAGGNQSVALTWSIPSSLGGSTLASFIVQRSVDGVTWTNTASVPGVSGQTSGYTYTFTGLTNGQNYFFQVLAVTSAPATSPAALINATPAAQAGAPTAVTAVPGSASSIVLSWTTPTNTGGSGVTDYWITYTPQGGTATVVKTGAAVNSYTFTGLTSYIQYTFSVAAFTTALGQYSATATATPTGIPPAPSAANANAVAGNGEVTLSWAKVTDTATVTGYTISYLVGANWVAAANSPIAQPSAPGFITAVIGGLNNGQQYNFRIATTSAAGPSAFLILTATPAGPPSAPVINNASASSGKVALSWTPPTNNGGAAITSYVIVATPTSGTPIQVTTPSASASFVITGLTNGTSYTFTVAAVTSATGAAGGPASAPSSPVQPIASASAVTNIVVDNSDGQITLTWNNATGAASYEITWTPNDSGGRDTTGVAAGATSSITISGLTNGQDYLFTISTINQAGANAGSASAVGVPGAAPSAPTAVTAVTGNTQASLTWVAPTTTGGSPVIDYLITVTPSIAGSPFRTNSANTSFTVTGLTNGTSYVFRVQAVNDFGNSESSTASNAIRPAGTPASPSGLVLTPADGQVTATWSAVTSLGGVALGAYVIQTSTDGITWETPLAGNVAWANNSTSSTTVTVTGLPNGSAIFIKVAAQNIAGVTGPFALATATPIAPPDAPVFSVVSASTVVKVSWSPVSNVGGSPLLGYIVFWTPQGGTRQSATVNPLTSAYDITGLTNGVPVAVRVVANTLAGNSTNTATQSATPVGVPGTVTSIVATAGDGQVSVSFGPANNGGSALTQYLIEYSTNGGAVYTVLQTVTNVSQSSYTAVATNLTNGTPVIFRITATSTFGTGVSATVTSTPSGRPGAPTNLNLIPSGLGSAILSWTAPTFDGGALVTGYGINYRISGTSTWNLVTANTGNNATFYNASGLAGGNTYDFQVVAVNVNGAGTPSATATITAAGSAGAPLITTVIAQSGGLIPSWTPPTVADGVTISGYSIDYSINGSSWINVQSNLSALTYTITGLTNGQSYLIRVAAVVGGTAGSYAVSFGTPTGALAAPTSLQATAQAGSVLLSWTAPVSVAAPVTNYRITVSPVPNGGSSPITVGSSATSFQISNLTNGTAYTFTVAAYNSSGWTAASSSVTATPVTTPSAPTLPRAQKSSKTGITLSWVAPTVSANNLPITGYSILTSTDGVNWTQVATPSANETSTVFTDSTLDGSILFISVAAVTSAGNGPSATTALIRAWSPEAPAAPTATPLASGSVSLSWTAPTTNGYAITGYKVEYAPAASPNSWTTGIADTTSSATAATLSGLTNGVPYVFRVTAINALGIGAAGATSLSATPVGTASAPTNISLALPSDAASGQLYLSYGAPTSLNGSTIIRYIIQKSTDNNIWTDIDTSTTTSYTAGSPKVLTGLTNGVQIFVRVAAITTAGTGAYALAVNTPITLPSAPASVSASSGDGYAIVSWTPPTSNGGSQIMGYYITNTRGGVTETVTVTSLTSSFTINNNIVNGTPITITVAAYNSAGTGPAGTTSTTPIGFPGQVGTISATAGDQTATVNFSSASFPGSTVVSYSVSSSTDGVNWTTLATIPAAGPLTWTIASGLTNGVPITFRVTAIGAGSVAGQSRTVTVTPSGLAGAPTGLSANNSGNGSVLLNWSAPTNLNGLPIGGYLIEYRITGTTTWTLQTANTGTTGTFYNVTGLNSGTSYEFQVATVNANGTGAFTAIATLVASGSAGAPTITTITSQSQGAIINWTAPTVGTGVTISGYNVDYGTDGTNWTNVSNNLNALTYTITGALTNGTSYLVRVAAIVGGNAGQYAVKAVTPTAAPGVPVVAAPTVGSGTVLLTWTAPSATGGAPITNYRITISPAPSGVTSPVEVGSSATSYQFSGLTNGTTYSFTVAAFNSSGWGSASASVNAVPVTTPDAPTSLEAVKSAKTSISITWVAPSVGANNLAVTGYSVETSTTGSTWTQVSTPSAGTTSETITSTSLDGSKLFVRVAANTSAGFGSYAVTAVILAWTPEAPSAPTITQVGSQSVAISWTAPNSNGYPITGYRIEYAAAANPTVWTSAYSNTGNNGTTATINSGLANGTAYIFRVSAFNALGNGGSSVASTSATPGGLATAPASISLVIPTPAASGTLNLSYTAPSNLNGGSFLHYIIQSSIDAVTWSDVETATTTTFTSGSPRVITGLTDGTKVFIRVAAVTSAGIGAYATVNATPIAPAGAPTSLTAISSDASATLSWTAPTSTGGTAIASYKVYIAESTSAYGTGVATNSTSTFYTLTQIGSQNLVNGTSYKVKVTTINDAGESLASNEFTIIPRGPAAAPTGLTATALNATDIQLSWTAPAQLNGGSLTGYAVQHSSDGVSWTDNGSFAPSVDSFTVTGLPAGATAYFRVAGLTNTTILGAYAYTSGAPTQAPGMPTITSVVPTSFTAVTVSWNPPSTTGGTALSGYIIQYKLAGASTWTTATANTNSLGTSYSVTGLTTGATYNFQVAAINASATGFYSAPGVTTITANPGAIQSLSAVGGNTQVTLTWTPPNDTSTITSYKVEQLIGGNWVVAATPGISAVSYIATALANGVQTQFRVSTLNSLGVSTPITVTSAGYTAPAAPSVTSQILGGQLIVSWVTPDSGGLQITGYDVVVTHDGVTDTQTVSATNSYTTSNYGTLNTVKVRAITSGATAVSSPGSTTTSTVYGPFSSDVSPASIGAPGTPSIISTIAGDATITVQFAPPTVTGGITSYRVEKSFDGTTWTVVDTITATSATSYTFNGTGFTNGITALIKISAVSNQGPGNGATVTATPSTTPDLPTNVTAGQQGAAAIISWVAPINNGGSPLTTYVVRTVAANGATPIADTTIAVPATTASISIASGQNIANYSFRVQAVNANGASAFTTAVAPTLLPDRVQSLVLTPGNEQIAVNWTSPILSSVVTGYRVEISRDGGTTWESATALASNVLTYTYSGLVNGSRYYIRVSPNSVAGFGPALVTSTVPATTTTAPQTLTVVPNTADSLLAIWKAPASDGGSPVSGYRIDYKLDSASTWTLFTQTTTTSTTIQVSGLQTASRYDIRISAINAAGTSAPVTSANSTLVSASTSSVVGLSATNVGDRTFTLTWSDSSSATSWSYKLSTDGGLTFPDSGTVTSKSLTLGISDGIQNGLDYLVSISTDGINFASTTVRPFTNPGAVTGLTVIPQLGSLQATWTAPTNTGGSPITAYSVTLVNAASVSTNQLVLSNTALFANLDPADYYTLSVAAVTQDPSGNYLYGTVSTLLNLRVYDQASAIDSATAVSADRSGVISWNTPVSNALGGGTFLSYLIEVSTNGTSYSVVESPTITVSGGRTSVAVNSLTNGLSYFYRISVVTEAGNGISSILRINPASRPSAPTITNSSVGTGSSSIAWSAPTDNGGLVITGYRVRINSGAQFETITASTTPISAQISASAASISGLTNGTTYTVEVAAVTSGGVIGETATVIVTPYGLPTAVGSLSAISSSNTATLSWNAPSTDGGSPLTGYLIEKSSDASTWSTVATAQANDSTFIAGSLTNGTTYIFRIAAINSIGNGPYATVSAKPLGAPSAPQSIVANASDGQIALTWMPPTSDGGTSILGSIITISDGATSETLTVQGTITTSIITTFGGAALINGTTYTLSVAATNGSVGMSSASVTAIPAAIAEAVLNLVATQTGSGAIQLTWSAPVTPGVTAYKIEQSINGTTWTVLNASFTGDTLQYPISGLTNGSSYFFRISALTAAGLGAPSVVAGTPASPPAVPTNLIVIPSDGQAALSWSAPANTGGSALTSFSYSYKRVTEANWSSPVTTYLNTLVTVPGLTNGVAYQFVIYAVNAIGTSDSSTAVTATPYAVPRAPLGVNAQGDSTAVVLSWNIPSVQDLGGLTGSPDYLISYSLSGITWTPWTTAPTISGNRLTTTITGLNNGTSYLFRVAIQNAVAVPTLTSDYVTVAATPASASAAPASISVSATSTPGQVSVSWTAPANNGGYTITGYRVEYSTTGSAPFTLVNVTGDSATVTQTVSSLSTAISYTFRVAAVTSAGIGAYVTASSAISPVGLASAPLNFAATIASATSVHLRGAHQLAPVDLRLLTTQLTVLQTELLGATSQQLLTR